MVLLSKKRKFSNNRFHAKIIGIFEFSIVEKLSKVFNGVNFFKNENFNVESMQKYFGSEISLFWQNFPKFLEIF